MKKKYQIPEDLKLLLFKSVGAEKIRDLAVKLPFGYRKAIRAAADYVRFETLFWKRVYEIYPEIKGKIVSYNLNLDELYVKDKPSEDI